ncbi:MAG TPA: tyrosine-type recombinase/integrase [Flavobacteriales bacterium]|nr:tyrosine-type recombinase/integrase [Flavobacteriales bacterium]
MKKYARRVKFLNQAEFFSLFQKFIADSNRGYRVQKNGQRIKPQSIDNYTYTLKLLERFCRETEFEIRLYLVNHLTQKELKKAKQYWQQFYFKFTDYLYRKGYFDNYVGSTVKIVRIFFNYLAQELQIQVGLFHKNFHVPKEDIPIVVFSPDQLKYLIHDKELHDKLPPDLQITKDVFVFGCTVALRISDLMALKPFHLVKMPTGHYLQVKSKKTGTDTSIKLPDYAIDIIKKYKNKQSNLLPQMSNGYFNKQLKELAAYIADKEPMIKVRLKRGKPTMIYKDSDKRTHYTMADHVTAHTMRRTAITTMLRLGVPEQVVRKISGHAANSREFYKYVAFSQTYQDTETDKMFEKLGQVR